MVVLKKDSHFYRSVRVMQLLRAFQAIFFRIPLAYSTLRIFCGVNESKVRTVGSTSTLILREC